MAKYPKYKVAAVQAAPVYLDLDASVDKAIGFIKEAADQGVKLIGFPEGYLPGYPWIAFLGRALDYVPRFYHKLYLNAVECPSSAMVKISQAARDNDIFVCMGGSEKDGGSLYLTQFWFDNKGNFDADITDACLGALLDKTPKAVIPGFYGAMPDGTIKTFSRGGSDFTGSVVAKAAKVDLYENWTDVSGFLVADPVSSRTPRESALSHIPSCASFPTWAQACSTRTLSSQ